MTRFQFVGTLLIALAVLISACSTALQAVNPDVGTGIISTAVVGTAEPILLTELPPNYTPPPSPVPPTPTPIPTLPDGLGPTELKYLLLEEFPAFFFCDPDYYPVARDDELMLALQRFSELQANPEEFTAILKHNSLDGLPIYTNEQKLLIYQDHKKLTAILFEVNQAGYSFQIQVAETEGRGELVSGNIDSHGKITVQERTPSIATCPICLAAGTLIDTPRGTVPVEDLRLGTLAWTMDAVGKRVARPVAHLGKTVVPASQQVVHVVLDDGRELWVSAGHPTVDGRRVGELQVGDAMDGARVRSTERVAYPDTTTYDLLPAGDTGFYWANGILLASSLNH